MRLDPALCPSSNPIMPMTDDVPLQTSKKSNDRKIMSTQLTLFRQPEEDITSSSVVEVTIIRKACTISAGDLAY